MRLHPPAPRRVALRRLPFALSLLALAACGPSSTPDDGAAERDAISADGADAPDSVDVGLPDDDASTQDATTEDVGAPDASRGTSPRFGACAVTNDCATGSCLTLWPGGLCTNACTSDAQCGAVGRCFVGNGSTNGMCVPLCTVGGMQCNETTSCRRIRANDPNVAACVPSCWAMPPAGAATCGEGLVCDPYNGGCVRMTHPGFDNGAGCTAADQCRGRTCILPTAAGGLTGFVGGTCVSYARGVSISSYVAGQPLPQSNCPVGSAAIPYTDAVGAGDTFVCYKRCTAHGDCRQGYECAKDIPGGAMASDGVCRPIDCASPPEGRFCPTGTTCQMRTDGRYRCG